MLSIKSLTISPNQSAASIRFHAIFLLTFIIIGWMLIAQSGNMPNNNEPSQQYLGGGGHDSLNTVTAVPYDVVFVTRKMVKHGSNFQDSLTGMPGVGPHSRFRYCGPGKLQILKTNGTIITLINGSNPTIGSLNLIDVNAPNVNYAGTQILFAGLPAPPAGQTYDTLPAGVLGAWRIYKINVNGTGLTQLTFTDLVINSTQFNLSGLTWNNFSLYDDIDPVWMPDGRICFSSTRSPSLSDKDGSRTSNLWVMNANGTSMHRITSERNGAERPVIDPLTGKIVFARWWTNGRFPIDAMGTQANTSGTGFIKKDGITSNSNLQSYQSNLIKINVWTPSSINPDGTDLALFAGGKLIPSVDFTVYGASFTTTGDLVANYFPQNDLVYESGFGGIVVHPRGAGIETSLAGYTGTQSTLNAPVGTADSLSRYYSANGFASDPFVLPDNRIIFSYTTNYNQDYGIYVMNADGTNRTLLYDIIGTTQLRPQAILVRPVPPVIVDQNLSVPFLYPPFQTGPYDVEGTFIFNCLNVYANGPVDMNISNAVKIGDAGSIRFYINHQRTRINSDPELDWPIFLDEKPVNAKGAVLNTTAPANQPLFEQMRTTIASGYKVPATGWPTPNSTAFVAGLNYGKPGATATCVGCHRGHTLIPVPANPADAEWTNLAPGATVSLSSGQTRMKNFINDRRVKLAMAKADYWATPNGSYQNQWTSLKFPVSIKIKTVRVYNIPFGVKNSTLQVTGVQVDLYADAAKTQLVSSQILNQNISENGTDVNINNVVAKVVQVKILAHTGKYNSGNFVVGLAEVEVIASGDISTPRTSDNIIENLQCDVYPNPVHDITNLSFKSTTDGTFTCEVYNISGEIILKKELSFSKDEMVNDKIDLSDKPAGVYIVSIKTGSTNKVVKIMKL